MPKQLFVLQGGGKKECKDHRGDGSCHAHRGTEEGIIFPTGVTFRFQQANAAQNVESCGRGIAWKKEQIQNHLNA